MRCICSAATYRRAWSSQPDSRWYLQQIWLRGAQTATTGSQEGDGVNRLQQVVARGTPARVVAFEISRAEAAQAFERYQRDKCYGLHAPGLLSAAANSPSRRVLTGDTQEGLKSTLGEEITPRLVPAFLPFWCFDATVSMEVKGTLGFQVGSSKEMVWKEMEDWKAVLTRSRQHAGLAHMQVCASYKLAPQLADGAKLPVASGQLPVKGTAANPRDLTAEEVQSLACVTGGVRCSPPAAAGGGTATAGAVTRSTPRTASGDGSTQASTAASAGSTSHADGSTPHTAGGQALHDEDGSAAPLLSPDMTQAIAWQLAQRALINGVRAEAEAFVKADTGAAKVQDLQVKLQVHDRHASILYLPAYLAHYQYGTRYKAGTTGVIMQQWFDALIGGTRTTGSIVAPFHVSPPKVQLVASVAMGATWLAGSQAVRYMAGLGPLTWMGGIEALTLAFLMATAVGSWARQRAQKARNLHSTHHARLDALFFRQFDEREAAARAVSDAAATSTTAPVGDVDEHLLWLWSDYEWRGWESEENWVWQEEDRWRRAEALWRKQMQRSIDAHRHVERQRTDRERHLREARADSRRRKTYGPSSTDAHQHHHHHHHHRSEAAPRHGRRDFLGYYKVMGISSEDEVTEESIKAAFKAAALLSHPDRVTTGGADAKRAAHARFHKLRMAYDVLKDSEKRQAYDRGQLTDH